MNEEAHVRLIPRLDIKGPNLVKGIHLEGLRVLGRPERFARHYYEQGADELIYIDAVASLYGRNSLLGIIERTSREVFIPLAVGGGIRTIEDIRTVLRAGADKTALNTAAVRRPEIVREASRKFGSSTIVVSIDAIRTSQGTYEVYTDGGRERTGVDAVAWAIRAAELGAGELLITSIDREGTGRGFDLELTRRIAEAVPIPVIACGGAGGAEDVAAVVKTGKADAVALASLLHYDAIRAFALEPPEERSMEGNTEFLKSGRSFAGASAAMQPTSLDLVKAHLCTAGIPCRRVAETVADV